jgi:hypothetical protein
MMAGTAQSSLVNRMVRAARLDNDVYEEVEADQAATGQAAVAVVIVAALSGLGAGLKTVTRPPADAPGFPMLAPVGGVAGALVVWVAWSYVTYLIGTRLFGGKATPGEMLRAIGFAQSPGALNVLGFIPVLGGLVQLVAGIWLLVAGVVAVRQALDFGTGKAILTTVFGWLSFILAGVLLAGLGLGAVLALGR